MALLESLSGRETPIELLADAAEELGELSRSIRKDNDEPPHMEAMDLVICGLALYVQTGGQNIQEDYDKKLHKWKTNVKQQIESKDE